MATVEDEIRDEVLAELIACYGEGPSTDWAYLTDLCDLIVSMIEKHAQAVIDGRFRAVLGCDDTDA